jgi:hypothetical protein|tara:strand:+ start:759 stop:905 length:147 start_codon:yes stop_codon:yes gene_type:complete
MIVLYKNVGELARTEESGTEPIARRRRLVVFGVVLVLVSCAGAGAGAG